MTGHLSVADEEESQVVIEGSVSIYRDPDRDDEVVAATDDQEFPLGIMDITVSRMDDGAAPVVVEPDSDGVEIRNVHNENGVTVDDGIEERTVQEGSATWISDDATVDIGFDATLELIIE